MAGATVAAAPTTAAVAPPTLFEEELLQSLKKRENSENYSQQGHGRPFESCDKYTHQRY